MDVGALGGVKIIALSCCVGAIYDNGVCYTVVGQRSSQEERVLLRVVLSDINSGILSYPLNFLSLMDLYRL